MLTIEINMTNITNEEVKTLINDMLSTFSSKEIDNEVQKRKEISINFLQNDNESEDPPMQVVYQRLQSIYIILTYVSVLAAIGAGLGAIWGIFADSLLFPSICTLIGAVVGLLVGLFNMKRSQNKMPLKPSND